MRTNTTNMTTRIGLLAVVALAACTGGPDEPTAERQALRGQSRVTKAALPAVVGDCDGADPAPGLCAWAGALDALVVGTVEELRLLDRPIVIHQGEKSIPVNRCDGAVRPAMELTLRVERALLGRAPRTIKVRVGAEQLATWNPRPRLGRNGAISWQPQNEHPGEPLSAGARVGAGLRRDGRSGLYSLMGEALFNVDAGVRFQEQQTSCTRTAPDLKAALTLDALARKVKVCQPSAASDRHRRAMKNVWGARPEQVATALCIDARRAGPEPCVNDCDGEPDCELPEECR
jgi:hypothetical protein